MRFGFQILKSSPKRSLKVNWLHLTLKSVNSSLNWWALLAGDLRISEIKINEASINAFVNTSSPKDKTNKKTSQKALQNIDFSILKQIPIDDIKLVDVDLLLKIEPQQFATRIDKLNLELNNLTKKLRVHFSSNDIHVKKLNEDPILSLSLSTNFVIDPQ